VVIACARGWGDRWLQAARDATAADEAAGGIEGAWAALLSSMRALLSLRPS